MHYSYYKRPLLWVLLIYIAGLLLFYTPRPAATDIVHCISDQPVTVTGKVIGFPTLKKKYTSVILQVSEVDGQRISGKLYARLENGGLLPRWHETVQLTGRLRKPYSIDVLGSFDWAGYLATKHIFAEIKVTDVKPVAPPSLFFRTIAALRADILSVFEQHFNRSLAAIAGGVLLGERGEIDPQLYSDFQDSGAIHLLVASGGNVGFVTLMVFAFCALFGLKRKPTALLALAVAGCYTLLAGADAPLVRAYFMTLCATAGYFFHRNSGVFQGLVISCLIILLINPAAVFETGFQMSFLATLAIVICLNTYTLPYRWPKWVKFFAQIFLATLSTQLILLPVFTNVFFKVSVIGLLANMLLVPLASVLMAETFLFYLFSCLHVGFVLQAVTGWLLGLFAWLVQFFASVSWASWPAAAWRSGWVIAYYAGLFLLFHLPQREFCKRIYKPILVIMLAAPLVQQIFFNSPTAWIMSEWNKHSILIRFSDGKRVLVGADLDAAKLARAVYKSGGRKLHAVLLNQDSKKERENVEALQQLVPVQQVIMPFENRWPGEEFSLGKWQVQMKWAQFLNRQNKVWTQAGYSGWQDAVSYTFSHHKIHFTTAGNNRFLLVQDDLVDGKQNATREVNLYYNVKTP